MSEREAVLDRRVRWFDRWRRPVAVVSAVLVTVFVADQVATAMGSDWRILAVVAGIISWLVFEVALASVTALWETELDRLLAIRGLPRAEVRSRRWPMSWRFSRPSRK